MREFINEFGKENFTIIAIVILVILVSLVVIVLLEKEKINKIVKGSFNQDKNDEKMDDETAYDKAKRSPEKHLDYKPLQAQLSRSSGFQEYIARHERQNVLVT